jgi:hypothetical protein
MSGEAVIKAEPKEYVITPYFEYTNADKAQATQAMTKESETITAKLKELGVSNENVKSDSSAYDRYDATGTETTNTLRLQYTITLDNKELAQKVQDYLVTLSPQGQISPVAQFSESQRKDLEAQAREKAIEDARAKAEKTATQLQAKVGKVIAVSDGAGYGSMPMPYAAGSIEARSSDVTVSSTSLPIQAGQNEFRYSVTVEYELK